MSGRKRENLRGLPAIGKLLAEPRVQAWLADHPAALVTEALRLAVEDHRRRLIGNSGNGPPAVEDVLEMAGQRLVAAARPSLCRVINATGVVLHTGLGRAPLGEAALAAIAGAAGGYCNLELDLATGERGQRSSHVAPLLCRLTGAEAATVVNNNAAATMMVLKCVATLPPASRATPPSEAQAKPATTEAMSDDRPGCLPENRSGWQGAAVEAPEGTSDRGGASTDYRSDAGASRLGEPRLERAAPKRSANTSSRDRRRLRRRNVIVSRGQLVEIGGSFRLPEIMSASGIELREVGTTNRTRIEDYRRAIDERTAALMRVHTSNYRIVGFTEDVPIGELAALGREYALPVIDDLGSGALLAMSDEPVVSDSIRAGADLVCFSGDKLLGGPQAGIIAGGERYIRAIEAHPLMRTYRLDKLVLLALEATLRCYLDSDTARRRVPALAMLEASPADLERRAQQLAGAIQAAAPSYQPQVRPDASYAGGGSRPAERLPTSVVAICPQPPTSAAALARGLRLADPPIIARIHGEAVLLDVRTLADGDFQAITAALARLGH